VLITHLKDFAKRLPIHSDKTRASVSGKDERELLGKRVGKCGAKTGLTYGKVCDGILSRNTITKLYEPYQIKNIPEQQDYSVLAVVGEGPVGSGGPDAVPAGRFAGPGDSGAWIIDSAFEVIGMLFGGERHGNQDLTYFTPLNAILKDVERMTDMVGLEIFQDSTCYMGEDCLQTIPVAT
jgi:hypothetical protein